MATEVTLPELGESVTEGTITAWLVDVGDTVEQDQPLFELSSDKIDTEVPSPVSGTLTEIKVNVDDTVDVGTVVAVIGDADEAAASDEGGGGEEAEQQAPSDEGGGEDTAPAASAGAAGGTEGGPAEGGQAEGGTEVVLPELGESVTEGTITGWLVEVGDEVEADQPLFELSSDKIDTEVPSPVSGTLTEIKVGVDETVDVGTVVAIIGGVDGGGTGGGGEQQQAASQEGAQEQEAPPEQDEPAVSDPTPATSQASEGQRTRDGIMMSPLVRRLVNEHDLDPASIQGSGQGGRITRNDVQKVLSERGAEAGDGGKQPAGAPAQQPQQKRPEAQPSKAPQPDRKPAEAGDRVRTEDLSRIRQRIAAKMMESLSSSAQLTTVQEADMSRIMALRGRFKEDFKQREGVSLSPFVFLCRAALIAIKSYEMANAKADWEAGVVTIPQYVNLGIAVDTEKGLLVPNIKNADDLTLPALARSIQDVANKARGKGKLEMRDIEGGTFTMTNTGSRGVLIDTPILNYPEVAILGTGAIQQRPVAVPSPEGPTIGIRSMVYFSLTYDHRLLDGADAARFVTEVKNVVETYDWEQELGY